MEQQNISSDLIRGHIDTIILHTLLSGDKFAQQISDSIEEKSEKEYKINQATLYSSLKRLESLRFVQSYWNDSDNGRRKYFKLTQIGKDSVESNLSNWSYSRAVIDKLMDCAPQPIIKTQYIEKIVEIPKEVIAETPKEVSPATSITNSEEKLTDNIDSKNQNLPEKNEETHTESIQEINFRNILNGLIKSTTIHRTTTAEQLNPLNKEEIVNEKPIAVQKFNETISSTDYNEQLNNNGKIDFGDLTLKAAKEGYKIRISSKESCIAKGTILINKLNFATSFLTLIIAIASLFFISFGLLKDSTYSKTLMLVFTVIYLLYPLFTVIKYLISPRKTSTKQITGDTILTSAIILFNLILITVAINLLLNVDFSNIYAVTLYMILPLSTFILGVLFFVIKFFLSKSKAYKIIIKK